MADEQPDDSSAVKAVKEALGKLHPDPMPKVDVKVLRKPLDLSDGNRIPRDKTKTTQKEDPEMSSDSSQLNGQYRALETRVEDLRGSHHELRQDMDARFVTLSAEIAKGNENMNARFDRVLERIESSKGNGGDISKYSWIVGLIVSTIVVAGGGFITLENNSIGDRIVSSVASLNDKITNVSATTEKAIARIDGQVVDLRGNTVGRNELDYRINGNRDTIKNVLDTQTVHSQDIAGLRADAHNLHDDVERMKGDIVTRRENEGHWSDLQNRVDLLSNRITDLVKATGGGDFGERFKQLQDQVNDFQRKFIAVPAFPKYNDK